MKKSVKIAIGVICLLAMAAAGLWYLLRPVTVETARAEQGDLNETLHMEGKVTPGRSSVVTAEVPGEIERLLCEKGASVQEGEELLILDDSRYQEQLSDQIASLEKQKAQVYSQGNSSQSEILLRQEQLIGQMDAARQQYRTLFGENGSMATAVDTARNTMEAAKSSYEAAVKANKEAAAATPPQEPPYSEAKLKELKAAWDNAVESYENAQLMNSDTNKKYYQSILDAYEAEFEALTENGNNGALTIQTAASEIQLSINALKREQKQEPVTAPFRGVVWEILAEEGSYVPQGQPLLRLYEEGEKKLEAEGVPEQMGAGYQVELSFSYPVAEQVVYVPLSALVPKENKHVVYVVQSGKAVAVTVETGVYCGGYVEITEGLSEGEEVVLNPEDIALKDGSRVSVISE